MLAVALLQACARSAQRTSITSPPLDRRVPPAPGVPRAYRFPDVHRRTLTNGLDLWIVERPSRLVEVRLVVGAGVVHEPLAKAGLASLTSAMLQEGTATRSAAAIADELDFLGAQMNAGVTSDGAVVSLSSLSRNLEASFRIFAEVVQNATIPAAAWERVRKQRLAAIPASLAQPQTLAIQHFVARVYGANHPYGRAPQGIASTVSQLTVEDGRIFHRMYYRPDNAVLIVVGDVRASTFVPLVESNLADWQPGAGPEPSIPRPEPVGVVNSIYLVDRPGSTQSELSIGHPAIARGDPAFTPYTVLNSILGEYIVGRLWQNLRETKGYAYAVGSYLDARRFAGAFRAQAAVQTDATAESVRELVQEIRQIRNSRPIMAAELESTRRRILGREPMATATSAQIAARLQEIALQHLPTDVFETFNHNLLQLSSADIESALTRLQAEPLTIVVVGDRRRVEGPLRTLGIPVEIVDTGSPNR